MTITAATLRRLAAMDVPIEALREFMLMMADQEEVEEQRRAKDRARKKTGKSMERDRNFHGTGQESEPENPKTPVVDSNNTPDNSGNNTSQQQRRPSRASRGTRLPDDFEPIPNILELARSLGFSDAEYWDHFERFQDYWRGVSGAKGVKLDWQGTWRNRIKDLADHRRSRTNGKPPQNTIAEGFKVVDAFVDELERRERAAGVGSG